MNWKLIYQSGWLLCGICLFATCHTSRKEASSLHIAPEQMPIIQMTKTPCRGQCPVYTFDIFVDGTCRLKGRQHLPWIGKFHATLSETNLTRIRTLFSEARLDTLNHEYLSTARDLPTTVISLPDSTSGIKIRFQRHANAPELLFELEQELARIVDTINWVKD